MFSPHTIMLIKAVYIILAFVWTVIVYSSHLRGWILVIPYIVLLIGYWNVNTLTDKVEDLMSKGPYINIGIILAFGLLQWILKEYNGKRCHLSYIATSALILTLLTYIDVWANEEWQHVIRVIRSYIQVMGITLFIHTLMIFQQNVS